MPGPGTGTVGLGHGSASARSGSSLPTHGCSPTARRRQRHGVAAERQQPVKRGAELRAKAVEARIVGRHEPVELDQRVAALGMLARRDKRAAQIEPGQDREQAAAADMGAFSVAIRVRSRPVGSCAPRPIASASLLSERALPRPANGSRAITCGAASRPESRCRHHGSASSSCGIGSTPTRRPSLGNGADHLVADPKGQHRRVAAVMVARDVPKPGRCRRGINRDREMDPACRVVAASSSRQIRTRLAAGSAPLLRATRRRRISASRAG